MDKAERKALIEKYGRAYGDFIAGLKEIPKEMWQFKPAPKEWSVHEVIVHLADSETNSYLRARRMIAEGLAHQRIEPFGIVARDVRRGAGKIGIRKLRALGLT